jgi:hypothetical protein
MASGNKTRKADFIATGLTGQTGLIVIRYLATKSILLSSSPFCFKRDIVNVKLVQCFCTGVYYTVKETVPRSTTRWHQVYMNGKWDVNLLQYTVCNMSLDLDLVPKTLPRWQDNLNTGIRHVITGQFCTRKKAGAVLINIWKIPFSVRRILYLYHLKAPHFAVTSPVCFRGSILLESQQKTVYTSPVAY